MLHIGRGCLTAPGDNSTFNPKPSTPRGERRHAARNEAKKAAAAKAWEKAKSNRPRNYRPKPNGAKGRTSESGFTQS